MDRFGISRKCPLIVTIQSLKTCGSRVDIA